MEYRNFRIDELIPLEEAVEERVLAYYSGLWQRECSLARVDDAELPEVVRTYDGNVLINGNHRAVFYLLHGIEEIEASFRMKVPDIVLFGFIEPNLVEVKNKGIGSVRDLADSVRNPERFVFNA